MNRINASWIVVGVLAVSFTPSTHAQEFEALADKAELVDANGLAALLWTETASCTQGGDDLQKRLCVGVRTQRREEYASRTFLIDGDAQALSVGDWDGAKHAYPVFVRGCLACKDPIDGGGASYFVVGRGEVSVQGGALRGPVLYKGSHVFAKDELAENWRERVASRLKTQLLFRIGDPEVWTEKGVRGIAVDIVGFRTFDPCDGSIEAANPKSLAASAEKCGAEVEEAKPTEVPKELPRTIVPSLPERLSPAQVSAALLKTRAEVNACFGTYGVPGTAKVAIEIGGDGLVRNALLTGDFEDTPTGDCIVGAIRKAEFPKFRAPSMTIRDYPFILR